MTIKAKRSTGYQGKKVNWLLGKKDQLAIRESQVINRATGSTGYQGKRSQLGIRVKGQLAIRVKGQLAIRVKGLTGYQGERSQLTIRAKGQLAIREKVATWLKDYFIHTLNMHIVNVKPC